MYLCYFYQVSSENLRLSHPVLTKKKIIKAYSLRSSFVFCVGYTMTRGLAPRPTGPASYPMATMTPSCNAVNSSSLNSLEIPGFTQPQLQPKTLNQMSSRTPQQPFPGKYFLRFPSQNRFCKIICMYASFEIDHNEKDGRCTFYHNTLRSEIVL